MRINEIQPTQLISTNTQAHSTQDIHIKTLKNKTNQINQQAKKVSAQQQLAKAQQKLAKVSSQVTTTSTPAT